jgi:hypothetical protein
VVIENSPVKSKRAIHTWLRIPYEKQAYRIMYGMLIVKLRGLALSITDAAIKNEAGRSSAAQRFSHDSFR